LFEVYTTKEVQQILKVDRQAVMRYIKAGQLKATKIGRGYRVTEEHLKEFLEHGTEKNYLQKL
jgi:excisionase family DNA binding protein